MGGEGGDMVIEISFVPPEKGSWHTKQHAIPTRRYASHGARRSNRPARKRHQTSCARGRGAPERPSASSRARSKTHRGRPIRWPPHRASSRPSRGAGTREWGT